MSLIANADGYRRSFGEFAAGTAACRCSFTFPHARVESARAILVGAAPSVFPSSATDRSLILFAGLARVTAKLASITIISPGKDIVCGKYC